MAGGAARLEWAATTALLHALQRDSEAVQQMAQQVAAAGLGLAHPSPSPKPTPRPSPDPTANPTLPLPLTPNLNPDPKQVAAAAAARQCDGAARAVLDEAGGDSWYLAWYAALLPLLAGAAALLCWARRGRRPGRSRIKINLD